MLMLGASMRSTTNQLGSALTFLTSYNEECDDLLSHIITGGYARIKVVYGVESTVMSWAHFLGTDGAFCLLISWVKAQQ